MKARTVAFASTIGIWLMPCGVVLLHLVRSARDAAPNGIEEYAQPWSFQVLNFIIGYLPQLLLVLAAALGAERLVFRGCRFLTLRVLK